MASEEDDALLSLIYQHLKSSGFKKAAKVLEKHVSQVETSEESSNLHEIYTGWMKLCSLAKQETDDSTTLKKKKRKSIKAEPEEDVDLKPSGEENHVDVKPPSDSVTEAETKSEQLQNPGDETKTTNCDGKEEKEEDKEEEEETQTELEHTLFFNQQRAAVDPPSPPGEEAGTLTESEKQRADSHG
ncbi:titin homolog isoform X3 [Xyrichtys novacula]|uniref:Titin homolog isoform X3 n=1 Tax=Xyrichtys novacula TaxID=13765 RepID=A0AAV1GIP2_XYRNO|nr:titin homolog isoform X3 [Xyrichtys novacula]